MTHLVKPKPPPCPPSPCDLFMSWEQMKQVREMIRQIMSDLVVNDPGVNALLQRTIIEALSYDPHVSNTLNTLINQQITASKTGVTDGSDPTPGQIGEFIELATPIMNFDGTADTQQDLTTTDTLPAGDWMCHAYCYIWVPVTGGQFYLNPQPAGLSDSMGAVIAQGTLEQLTLVGPTVNANLTSATAFTFTVNMNNDGPSGIPGTCQVRISAWRIR